MSFGYLRKDGVTLPSGDTSERPALPKNGTLRWNTQLVTAEIYRNGDWIPLPSGGRYSNVNSRFTYKMVFEAPVVAVPNGEAHYNPNTETLYLSLYDLDGNRNHQIVIGKLDATRGLEVIITSGQWAAASDNLSFGTITNDDGIANPLAVVIEADWGTQPAIFTDDTVIDITLSVNSRGKTLVTDEINVVSKEGTAHDLSLHSTLGHIWSSTIDLDGMDITDNGNGTIDLTSGTAYARTSNSEESPIVVFNTPLQNNVALVDQETNYIYADYNGGTPIVGVTTDFNLLFSSFNLPVAYAITRIGNTLHILNVKGYAVNYINNANVKDVQVNGFERATGGGIVINGSNQITIAPALFYLFNRPIQTVGVDTTDAGVFQNIYQDGVGGWTRDAAQTILPIDNWDDNSGTLATLGNSEYASLWIHVIHNTPDEYAVLLGQSKYNTQQEALDEAIPLNRPPELDLYSTGDQLYQVVVRGNGVIQAVVDLKATIGKAVTGFNAEHNELNSLQGGTTNEYYHVTNSEKTEVAKLVSVPTNTIRGRSSAGSGVIQNLTNTVVTAMLNVFTNTLKGLVPASGGGTTKFLRADGTWAAPSGGGGGSTQKYKANWDIAAGTGGAGLAGSAYAVLVVPESDITVASIECFLTAASSSTAYAGVYSEDGNTLLCEAQIDCNGTGFRSNTIIGGGTVVLTGGTPYWFTILEGAGAVNFANKSSAGNVNITKSKYISGTPTGLPSTLAGFTTSTTSMHIAVKV